MFLPHFTLFAFAPTIQRPYQTPCQSYLVILGTLLISKICFADQQVCIKIRLSLLKQALVLGATPCKQHKVIAERFRAYSSQQFCIRNLRNHLGLLNKRDTRKPKNYPCPLCDKRFSNNRHLRSHFRTHTGGKSFPCNFDGCEKRFARELKRI